MRFERPDREDHGKADIGVQKQFANKPITFNAAGESGGGFLFFPFDSDASTVTVVVHLGGEVFRFPFASVPSVPGKFGNPEHISTQTSALPITSPLSNPPAGPVLRAEANPTIALTSNSQTGQIGPPVAEKYILSRLQKAPQIVSS